MSRIRVNERHFEPEEPAVRLLVDQLHTLLGEIDELTLQVGDLVRDVVHAGPALGEKLAHVRLVAERRDELDPALANTHRRRLDALRLDHGAALEVGAEHPPVRLDRLVEVLDGNP